MAVTFRKKEVRKRQIEKRREKELRREAKRNETPDTFEEMIAYVNPNGVITDTPPNPEDYREVKLEEIEVSIPTDLEIASESELDGHVKFYNEDRGFGFIKDKESVEQYFFHISNAPEDIERNDHVTFRLEDSPRGLNAVEVEYA